MRVLFTIVLFLLIFFSSLRLVGSGTTIAIYGLYGLITILLLTPFLFRNKKFNYNKSLFILALLFTGTAIGSSIYNFDFGMIFNSVLFLFLFVSVTVLMYTYFKSDLSKIIYTVLLISHIPLIVIPLIIYGLDSTPYQGIYYNPNSLGMVCATLFTAIFSVLLYKLEKTLYYTEKPSKISLFIYFIVTTLLFVLIVFSASRTSFLAGCFTMLVGIMLLIYIGIKNKRTLNLISKSIKLIPLLIVLFFVINKFIPITLYVNQIIFSKFSRKSENLLDGRDEVWNETFRNAGLFGNGEGYFNEAIGLGAHNTFIYILGVYGWIPTIIFILFMIISLFFSFRFIFHSDDQFKFLPLFSLLSFLVLSMGENLFFKLPMILTFVLLGITTSNRKVLISIRS